MLTEGGGPFVFHSVLSCLALRGKDYPRFLCAALIKLLCRLTLLGWRGDIRNRMTVDDVADFFQVLCGCDRAASVCNHGLTCLETTGLPCPTMPRA